MSAMDDAHSTTGSSTRLHLVSTDSTTSSSTTDVHQLAAHADQNHAASLAGLDELMTFEVHMNDTGHVLLGDDIMQVNAHSDNSWVSSHDASHSETSWTDHTDHVPMDHKDHSHDHQSTHHDDGTLTSIEFDHHDQHHHAA